MQINAYVLRRTENASRVLVLQNEGKTPRVRPRRGWDCYIEVDLNFDGRAWIGFIWPCLE